LIPNSRFSSKLCIAVILAACAIPACAVDTDTAEVPDLADPTLAPQGAAGGGPEHVPGEVLIQWKAGASPVGKARARGKVNGAFGEDVASGLELAKLPPGLEVSAAVQSLASDPDIAFAEPNFVYHASYVPNDTEQSKLWGMNTLYGSGASDAWGRGINCDGVVVGIIDEGVMSVHPDLAPHMLTQYNRDFTSGSEVAYTSVNDTHGTHVAGTIGAAGDNGQGVIGVCGSGIRMVSAKFLGKRGGTTANAIKAVDYLTGLKKNNGVNIVATNNSWGGGGFSQGLLDAIKRSAAEGIVFVAAASNDGRNNDTTASYPSNYVTDNPSTPENDDSVIAVAAIDKTGALASWSNYGKVQVDLAAPGVSILSTYPVTAKGQTKPGYYAISGTSMATPHVTGSVARFVSRNPGASIAQIRQAILDAAKNTPTASVEGKTVTGGRLNISQF
jgi:subtilisin family serine protease